MPAGRPTGYKSEYCDKLIEHMRDGNSFETFAAVIEVSKPTLYVWADKYPAFLEAKRTGDALSEAWWEKQAKQGLWKMKGEEELNTTLWIFVTKNRFGYQDSPDPKEDDDNPYPDPLRD